MTDETIRSTGGDVHRLLDEAFLGIEMTADAQDLKEEVRVNLLARIAELAAGGHSPDDAAVRALEELGDIRELLGASAAATATVPQGWAEAVERHRVRIKPSSVVGAGIAALAAAVGLVVALLGASRALPLPVGVLFPLIGIGATGVAWIVGEALARETTTKHPMPIKRTSGYFFATLLAAYGLGVGGLIALHAIPLWATALAALGVVAGLVLFAILGATQTNRRKAWVRMMRRGRPRLTRRFADEPEVAVRFGIYTTVTWAVAFAGFVMLGATIGWAWSWLCLLGGFVVMMLTIARMLFRSI
ncbi:permease prefix domain 1-containing protein [Microbacterium sp. STN6]|uniref:permease prefix domain 1-containing protein n=1 Tax=Microbacterium sp. STN6 TaxID=2995588 RepID=UPI002260FCB1|nr:permease prefix domain 1-containing protein [Microbacterium sp. STN6]MCX7521379.1 permease prefix domain 1-containing protein [Microbacterium sp. STN6]